MAKIVIEFDTVTKLATATLDGTAVPDFASFDIYQKYMDGDVDESNPQQFSCSLRSAAEDSTNKMLKMQTVYASEQVDIKSDIQNYFAKKSPRVR